MTVLDFHGSSIASGHLDNSIRFWDTRTGQSFYEMSSIHTGQITSLKCSPSKMHLLSTSRDNTLSLIDIRTHDVIQTYRDPGFKVGMNWSESCISPDGSYVCSGGANGKVYIWDLNSGVLMASLAGHRSAVCSVAWNPNGEAFVYSAEKDRTLVFWHDSDELKS